MGQKVHPESMRVGYIHDWKSNWFNEKHFSDYLIEDIQIRNHITGKLAHAGLSDITIRKNANEVEVNIHTAPLYENSFRLEDAVKLFGTHGFDQHVSWRQSLNREANIVFRNRRFYPNPVVNRITSTAEQQARRWYFASLKVRGVLAVTGMMVKRRLLGATR